MITQNSIEYLQMEVPDLLEQARNEYYTNYSNGILALTESYPDYKKSFMATLAINEFESRIRTFREKRKFEKKFDGFSTVVGLGLIDTSSEIFEKMAYPCTYGQARYFIRHHKQEVIWHSARSHLERDLTLRVPDFDEQYVIKEVNLLGFIIGMHINPRLKWAMEELGEVSKQNTAESISRRIARYAALEGGA